MACNPIVELWVIAGPYWRLPVRVVWHQNLGECRPGGGANLTRKMRAAAEEMLASVGTVKGNTYWVERKGLEEIGRKFHGEDPEDCIEWLPGKQEKIPVRSDYDGDDFVKAFCESSFSPIRNTLIVDWVWAGLKSFMLHWLLNKARTVDLGFATLDAINLRKNWAPAAALEERFRQQMGKIEKKDFLSSDFESMARRGVPEILCSTQMLAADARERLQVYWTLECTTNEKWDRTISSWEKEKRRASYGGAYYLTVWHQMLRQLPRVLKIYARYLEEARRPGSLLVEGRSRCNYQERYKLPRSSKTCAPVPAWGVDPEMSDAMAQDSAPAMEAENAGVLTVSDLQSGKKNVRDAG